MHAHMPTSSCARTMRHAGEWLETEVEPGMFSIDTSAGDFALKGNRIIMLDVSTHMHVTSAYSCNTRPLARPPACMHARMRARTRAHARPRTVTCTCRHRYKHVPSSLKGEDLAERGPPHAHAHTHRRRRPTATTIAERGLGRDAGRGGGGGVGGGALRDACMHARMHACMHACTHACTPARTHIYMHAPPNSCNARMRACLFTSPHIRPSQTDLQVPCRSCNEAVTVQFEISKMHDGRVTRVRM